MISLDRTPEERVTFLRARLVRIGCGSEDIMKDVLLAFQAAEARGEARGLLKGQALAKLSDAERKALGL